MIESKNVRKIPVIRIKEFFRSGGFRRSFIAIIVGGLFGFLYYTFLGSDSGSGEIMSDPYSSIIWGAILAFFLVNSPCTRGRC